MSLDNFTDLPDKGSSLSSEPAFGPTTADEVIAEWQAATQLAIRLNDSHWKPEPFDDLPFQLRTLEEPTLAPQDRPAVPPLPPVTGSSRGDEESWAELVALLTEARPSPAEARPSPAEAFRSTAEARELPGAATRFLSVVAPAWKAVGKSKRVPLGERARALFMSTLQPLFRLMYRRGLGIAYHSGSEVVAAVSAETAPRVLSLMAVERALPAGADYGVAIAPACICLEMVLGELLRPIGQARAGHLAQALIGAGWPRQADLLLKWAHGQLPMTMGLQVTLLAAIEKANVAVQSSVAQDVCASSQYLEVVRSGGLATLLEQVRTKYRNPACHGTRTFSLAEYTAVAQLLLTRDRFRAWYRRGPVELNVGLLDLHLLEWRRRRSGVQSMGGS